MVFFFQQIFYHLHLITVNVDPLIRQMIYRAVRNKADIFMQLNKRRPQQPNDHGASLDPSSIIVIKKGILIPVTMVFYFLLRSAIGIFFLSV